MANEEFVFEFFGELRNASEEALAYQKQFLPKRRGLTFIICWGPAIVVLALMLLFLPWIMPALFSLGLPRPLLPLLFGLLAGGVTIFLIRIARKLLLPYYKNLLFGDIEKVMPASRVSVSFDGSLLKWNSAEMNIEVPASQVFAVRQSGHGVTIGVGLLTLFVPEAAFATEDAKHAFKHSLWLALSADARTRSAGAFQ